MRTLPKIIEISVTFTGLSTEAKDLFSAYIDNDVMDCRSSLF